MCSVSCWYVFRQFWRCQVSSMIAKLGLLSRWSPLSSPLQRPWQCFNMFWYVKCLKCFKISWTPKNDTVVCHFDMTNINIIYYPPFRGAQLSEVLFWIRFPFFFCFVQSVFYMHVMQCGMSGAGRSRVPFHVVFCATWVWSCVWRSGQQNVWWIFMNPWVA